MNWKSLIFPIVAILVIVFLSDYYGLIGFIVGIIVAILVSIIPILLTALFPVFLEYSLKPKVGLQIKDIRLVKRSSHNVEGHLLEALITNNGKKICSNLEATKIQIKDAQGRSPNLLYVSIVDTDGRGKLGTREASMTDVRYAWIDEKGGITQGVWKQLRKKGTVRLLFPYETMDVGILNMYGGHRYSSQECLLKLGTNIEYHVAIEVKGEDSDRVTAMGSKKAKIRPEFKSEVTAKPKDEKKEPVLILKERNTLREETIVLVPKEDYFYEFKLEKGDHIKGEIVSTERIDIYLVDRINFDKWDREVRFDCEDCNEAVLETKIDYLVPKKGIWYVLVENSERKAATVKVHLYAELQGQKS